MTLKKPSELFNKKIEENNISIIESDNTLRNELSKVENLSDQIIQLQQELSQKVIQSDLEELFSSQINNIQENFENLQNDFKKSNKRDINNFNELKNIVSNNITDVKEEVYNIVGLLSNNLEEYSKELLNIRADVIINEHHINKVNKYFKEGVFSETEKSTFNNIKNNIVRLEKKIDFIRETYSKIEPEVIIREAINQDILNDPSDTKNSDPLTPLDQKFVTLDQLQQHYRLFINRIQQQISTIGGGGETRLKYLDDIVGIATNSSSYDGKYLKYNHSLGKFEFADVSSSISGIATYASNAGIATFATSSGIATFASNAGIATFATSAGIATYASNAGIATFATNAGIATFATSAGIATFASNAGIATFATSSGIATYASNAGIATFATSSGIATFATNAGIATFATSAGIATFASNAGIATFATSSGIATYASNAGIATFATSSGIATFATNAGIATFATSAGIATFASNAGIATFATSSGIATYASNAGIATFATSSGIATFATNAGIATFATSAGIATFASNAGIATFATSSGIATYASNAGIATFATSSGIATYASNAGIATFATSSGIATFATSSGIATYASNAGIATFATSSGIATFATSSGIATYASNAGIATFATSSGIATFATNAGIATFATSAGIATFASNAGIATFATSSGIATFATNAGIATFATSAGIATFATSAGIATFASNAGIATFATSAGIATYTSEWVLGAVGNSDYTFTGPGLIGAENDPTLYLIRGQQYKFTNTMGQHPFRIQSIVNGSAGTQYNDGITNNDVSNGTLTWNVQFDAPNILYYQCTAHTGMGGKIYIIDAGIGPDISINTTGIITATSFVGNGSGLTGIVGSGSSQFVTTAAGIHTLSNVGIGTTNPQGTLQVGTGITMYGSTGIISATTFVGNFSGSITNATNLTGGYANASQLNVSGIATISQGRIQADGLSNLRFGNIAAGSGSGRNIAIGDQVLYSLSSGQGRNIGIGELSYYDTTSGQYNIGLGIQAGQKITTGNYNVILGGYDGQTGLDIRTSSNNVVIADGQGNIRQYINSSGNVGIKTTVITEALTVAGIVSATSFYGTLNAGQLTGSLPAINGSALIGVVGSGSGIIIQGNGTPVGTAGTINFASNLNVTFASGIATVSGTGLATYANVAGIATYATSSGVSTTSGTANYATSSGVSTTSGTAGYATTAGISSAVSASININTTGIITASSFSGSGSGLTNVPAAQLTGTLPAIDGSALLNVTAAGTGIAIRDDNSNIGSATTVNFGTGLDVTFSAGIATITASGGSLQSRTIVSGVTTSITNNGIGNTNITGFKSYGLMKVGLSTAGWLRLYTDSTSRTNDISRSVGEDPAPGSGVIAEVVTTGITTTQIISPFVMGGNLDNSPTTTIYAAIKNLSGTTQAITANLTILQLEA